MRSLGRTFPLPLNLSTAASPPPLRTESSFELSSLRRSEVYAFDSSNWDLSVIEAMEDFIGLPMAGAGREENGRREEGREWCREYCRFLTLLGPTAEDSRGPRRPRRREDWSICITKCVRLSADFAASRMVWNGMLISLVKAKQFRICTSTAGRGVSQGRKNSKSYLRQ